MRLHQSTPAAADIPDPPMWVGGDWGIDWPAEDPVMGLKDVAKGKCVLAPTTVYLQTNKDRSGVVGMLLPNGQFVSKRKSTTGSEGETMDEWNEVYATTVVWDGAQKQPVSATPIGYEDKDETKPLYQEHSKGILLGDYPNNGELWNALRAGRGMR